MKSLLTIDPSQAGPAIPCDFLGLSYETEQVLPNARGGHYFSPDNSALVSLFKTLGVKSLRIGGNSVDRPVTAIPNEDDIDRLFAFARAAGARVIYSVRLQDGDAQFAANIARHIFARFSDLLDYFAVGNEPAYYKPYENFREKWRPIVRAMLEAAPGAKFCAPDTNPDPAWCRSMVEEFGNPGPLSMLTVHNYPGDCSYTNPGAKKVEDLIPKDAAAAREQMLAADWYPIYAKTHKGMADAVAGTPLPFRLAETNNFWYGGLEGASNTFAAALWSVDYLYWWASHGAAGLNFHTGDRVGGGQTSLTSRYTAFVTQGAAYEIRPLSYGMKLFALGGGGSLIPIAPEAEASRLRTYATRPAADRISVTILNKSHGTSASDATVELKLASPKPIDAGAISLTIPNQDIAAKTGMTIGGNPIRADGSWKGRWLPLRISGEGTVKANVPAASAMVVSITY